MPTQISDIVRPPLVTPSPAPSDFDPELDLSDEELDALTNDPDSKWCSADEVMARLREIDACSP